MTEIRPLGKADLPWVKATWVEHWGGDFVLSRGQPHRYENAEGFIAENRGEKVGLITYEIAGHALEITSFNSFSEKQGIGTSLLAKVIELAWKKGLEKVWLVTTNDNINALRFYQKRGFHIVTIRPGQLEEYRKLKPALPKTGENDIPMRDEIELELILNRPS